MAKLNMLWLALEAIPGAEAVIAEWHMRLADDFESVGSLLRPTDRIAGGYPAPPANEGLPYRVVQHGPDDFVAVPPEGNEIVELVRMDVLIHQIDHRMLAKEIAVAFGFAPAFDPVPNLPCAWRVGEIKAATGAQVAVHLVLPLESADLQRAIEAIAAQNGEAGVIVAPTRGFLRPQGESLLRLTKGHFIALVDALPNRDGDRWLVTDESARLLDAYLDPSRSSAEEPLCERSQLMLMAMLELEAVDSDRRKTTEEVVLKACGKTADANALKGVMAELKKIGLVESKRGSGGGYWLTDSGRSRASKLNRV